MVKTFKEFSTSKIQSTNNNNNNNKQNNLQEDEEDNEQSQLIEHELTQQEIALYRSRHISWVDDLLQAIYDMRLAAPFFAFIAMLLAYHLTIAPYQNTITSVSPDTIDLAKIRPVLNQPFQHYIRSKLLYAETSLTLPSPYYDTINLGFDTKVNKYGNHQLPSFFYEGVVFGFTQENVHDVDYTQQNLFSYQELYDHITKIKPTPTMILPKSTNYNDSDSSEIGLAIYYSYQDLANYGLLSSDPERPWKRLQQDMLSIARKYKQIYMIVWYPHTFGYSDQQLQDILLKQSKKHVNPTNETPKESVQEPLGEVLREKETTKDTSTHTLGQLKPLPHGYISPISSIQSSQPMFKGKKTSKSSFSTQQTQQTQQTTNKPPIRHKEHKYYSHKYQYMTILQEVLPTRTGLNTLHSISTVWLHAVNGTDPYLFYVEDDVVIHANQSYPNILRPPIN